MKLGPHVLFGTAIANGWAARAPIMKAIDDRDAIRLAAAAGVPIRIFRHYFPEQDVNRDGAAVAAEILDALGDAPATHIELFNETAQRLGEGLERHLKLTSEARAFLHIQRRGLALIGFSFSTGQPQDEDWLYLWQHGFGGVQTIGLHEYWGPGLVGNKTRHRFVHTLLGGGHPPFLITECGRDAAGETRIGWRQQLTGTEYLQELATFAADIEELPYVLGATVFTAGANYGQGPQEWDSFDCDPLGLDVFDLSLPKAPEDPNPMPETVIPPSVNAENRARIEKAQNEEMVTVGKVYKIAADRGVGSQCVYTDAGEFCTRKGVPGAYFFATAESKPPFR
jgi:hypothetical protein